MFELPSGAPTAASRALFSRALVGGSLVGGALALAASGCAAGDPGAPSATATGSPSRSADAAPAWEAFDGEPVGPGGGGGSAADEAEPPEEPEPVEVPDTCEEAGLAEDAEAFAAMAPKDAQFTQVRGASALECSWAGFDRGDGSEVVLVSLSSEGSLVEHAGEVPAGVEDAAAEGSDAYFTSERLTELGGFAEWRPGERFSRVRLHLPGLLVTVQANSDTLAEEGGAAVEAAAASADVLLGRPAD